MVVFPPILVANTKLIYGCNFVAPLRLHYDGNYIKASIHCTSLYNIRRKKCNADFNNRELFLFCNSSDRKWQYKSVNKRLNLFRAKYFQSCLYLFNENKPFRIINFCERYILTKNMLARFFQQLDSPKLMFAKYVEKSVSRKM